MTGGIALGENSFTHFWKISETIHPIFNESHLTEEIDYMVNKKPKQGLCHSQQ